MSGTIRRKRVGRVRSGARQRRSRPTPLPVADRAAVGAAKIARLVVDGEAPRTPTRAERTLFSCLTRHWPDGAFVHTLMTAGGFVQLEMQVPNTVHKGWDARPRDIKPFVAEAAGVVKAILSKRVLKGAIATGTGSQRKTRKKVIASLNPRVCVTGKSRHVPRSLSQQTQRRQPDRHRLFAHLELRGKSFDITVA